MVYTGLTKTVELIETNAFSDIGALEILQVPNKTQTHFSLW